MKGVHSFIILSASNKVILNLDNWPRIICFLFPWYLRFSVKPLTTLQRRPLLIVAPVPVAEELLEVPAPCEPTDPRVFLG